MNSSENFYIQQILPLDKYYLMFQKHFFAAVPVREKKAKLLQLCEIFF